MIHPIMSFFLFFYSLVISNFLKLFTLHFEILKKKIWKNWVRWSRSGHQLVMMVTFSVYIWSWWSRSGHQLVTFSVYIWSLSGHQVGMMVMMVTILVYIWSLSGHQLVMMVTIWSWRMMVTKWSLTSHQMVMMVTKWSPNFPPNLSLFYLSFFSFGH